MAFTFNPRRDAWGTIAGFVFQVEVTILRWLDLRDTEVLELERGEDVDLVQQQISCAGIDENRLLEQVKRRSGTLTLRSPEVLEALANFSQHRSSNPQIQLRFRFLTTTKAGTEQDWDRDFNGIETWEAIRQGELGEEDRAVAIEGIRSLPQKAPRPQRVSNSAWERLQEMLSSPVDFPAFIANFEWSVGSGDLPEVEERIKAGLVKAGYASDAADANQLFDRLLVVVFKRLADPGVKRLTPADLHGEVTERRPVTGADRELVGFIRSQLSVLDRRMTDVEQAVAASNTNLAGLSATVKSIAAAQGLVTSIEFAALAVPVDIPDFAEPLICRSDVVRSITDILAQKSSVSIIGEPGSGKTQLSLLVARELKSDMTWLDIPRDCSVQQACAVIDAKIASLAKSRRPAVIKTWYEDAARTVGNNLVVLDTLPRTTQGDPLIRRIELLAIFIARYGGKLLVVSYYPLSRSAHETGNIGESLAPRLTDAEVTELLIAYGAPRELASQITTLVASTTQGLPVLVAAVARHLSGQSWTFDFGKFESILRAEFAQGARSDARAVIELTVPEADSRELLYRLTLPIGGFSRQLVSLVASVPPRIPLPNEKLEGLLGLWVQPFVGDRFRVSPLIDPAVSSNLDESTRNGVHARLAASILSHRRLDPLEVIACVFHFNAAGLFNQAALVMIQALTAFTEQEASIQSEWGFTSLWAYSALPQQIDINLRLNIRALQLVALDGRGRDIGPVLADLNSLFREAGETAWGTPMASSLIAIRFYRKYPILVNDYVLIALRSFRRATLPNGKPIPQASMPLEGLFWATAFSASTDAEVESWISSVSQLDKSQISNLAHSELAQDNPIVLSDGIWLREYRKDESLRDWDRVEQLVKRLEDLGRNTGLRVLEAAAMRTRIMITAEWRHDLSGAVRLAEDALGELDDDDSRFLITEVTGRQLSYARRSSEAIEWLQRARSFQTAGRALWRRNVLITLAEEVAKSDASRAPELTEEALKLSREIAHPERVIEALMEHGIALWNAGQADSAYEPMEMAVRHLLDAENECVTWKKLFLAVFHTLTYFSSITYFGHPPTAEGFEVPAQGRFLGLDAVEVEKFNPAQKSFIRMRIAMFAEGLGRVTSAGLWSDAALHVAAGIPDARTIYSLASLSIAPALLRGDYSRAFEVAMTMANAEVPNASGCHATMAAVATLFYGIPLAFRLATLRLQRPEESRIAEAIEQSATMLLSAPGGDVLATAFGAVFIEDKDWLELKKRADELVPVVKSTATGVVYMVGAAMRSPLPQALQLQIWLVRETEKLFPKQRSIRQELIYPFFEAFWINAVSVATHQFRTAGAYTRRVIESAKGSFSLKSVRRLLKEMSFCLGTELPEDVRNWLEESEQKT